MVDIVQIEGGMGLEGVKREWKSAIENRTTLLLSDTAALAMIIGIASATLESLREEHFFVKIFGIQEKGWMIRLIEMGSMGDLTPKQAYEDLYTDVSRRLAFGDVRMDEFEQNQNPLVFMFSQLPKAIQLEIQNQSKAPESLRNTDPAF